MSARYLPPRCMSTQHPDNAKNPFFTKNDVVTGDEEIFEAYNVFSTLKCDEQMWDCEGKKVDTHVVKELLSKYDSFFSDNVLGSDVYLTLRVPNPDIEKTEAKILLEALENIPRSYDAARAFYQEDYDGAAPIFEVILPMTTSAGSVQHVYEYYKKFVVDKQEMQFSDGTVLAKWVGEFKPENINVIPLFEDTEHILGAGDITKKYIEDKDLDYQRVFLARSDPAMNYGLVTAVLLNKIALMDFHEIEKETGVHIYPIIGVGSPPFRGGLAPETTGKVTEEYPGVHTFTIQSAFKYDNPQDDVRKAVEDLVSRKATRPRDIDKESCVELMDRYSCEYQRQVALLAPLINKVANYVPDRRMRKLHVGLYGYERNIQGIRLPRAIKFASALYSIGFPPELLGLNALHGKDIDTIKDNYIYFEEDLISALRYFNKDSLKLLPNEMKISPEMLNLDFHADEKHKKETDLVIDAMKKYDAESVKAHILNAARLRKFLG